MQARKSTWFETKIKYDKIMENGLQKSETEQYMVDALSFTEAEARIVEEMSPYIRGDFEVTDIKQVRYAEIYFHDLDADELWFKAKLQFISINEKTGKEKRESHLCLVQAPTFQAAVKCIDEEMGKTMIDYVIASVQETALKGVFEHKAKTTDNGR